MGEDRHLSTEAIILKIVISSEINKNFIFISPTLGIQSATAFGAAKTRSRFCSSVQSFVKATFFLYKSPKTDFYKLEDISHITSNDFIRSKLNYIYLTSFFSEILLDCYITLEEYKKFYYLLLYSIEILKECKDIKKAFIFFTSKFLFLSGYNFNLNFCKKCKKEFDFYYFDNVEGGIFCENHAKNKNFRLQKSASFLFKDFLENKYLMLKERRIEAKNFNQIFPIILFIIKNIFEKELKTISFVEEILK